MSSSGDPNSERPSPASAIDALIQLRDAAEVLSANFQNILQQHETAPEYSTSSSSPQIRQAQKRAQARIDLMTDWHCIELIRKGVDKFRFIEASSSALWYVQRAVALKTPPVFFGTNSYATAHEASLGLGIWMDEIWQSIHGDHAVEVAPDRMHAEVESEDADVAINVNDDLWRIIERIRPKLPADLWGQIQQEYFAAGELVFDEEDGRLGGDNAVAIPDPCGKWLYELWMKGMRGTDIVDALRERRRLKAFANWPELNEYNSVKGRIKRYVAANGLPAIEPRSPGRPRKE